MPVLAMLSVCCGMERRLETRKSESGLLPGSHEQSNVKDLLTTNTADRERTMVTQTCMLTCFSGTSSTKQLQRDLFEADEVSND